MECPEAMDRGRNFRLLAEEELPELLDFLADHLPESLKFHQTLLTYQRDKVWDFHFYVANGWPEEAICLHFPGMTLSPHGLLYESVGVFCPNDRLELLKLLRDEDVLVDWSKPLYMNFVHHDIAEELSRFYEGTGTIETVVGDVFVCRDTEHVDDAQSEDEADPDVQVMPLKGEHAEAIHELYPANDMECHEVFLRLIRMLSAGGVFVKGNLAAWMVQSYYGAMFSMQTRPEYRRKGYGTKLARYLTKRVADRGYQPFVVIRPENEASQSLYKKLGFAKLYQTVRMTFTPSSWQEGQTESSNVLRDNLENAVRQLTIEQKIANAFENDGEISIGETELKQYADYCLASEQTEAIADGSEDGGGPNEESADEAIEEAAEDAEEATEIEEDPSGDVEGTASDGHQDDGGTEAADAE
nr:uncharacterized protein LOC117222191 [Megalopta genalis]XP_033329659.1 uncharacterized protein LOC117222191 [Megalopta genalis]